MSPRSWPRPGSPRIWASRPAPPPPGAASGTPRPTGAWHLRALLAEGRLPECWVPPAQILECRALLETSTLVPNVLVWLLTVSAFSSFFMLTLYLQQVLGYTPLQAGLGYIPLAVAVVAASVIASNLIPRIGPRPLAITGLSAVGTGLALLGHVPAGATYTANILPGLVLIGLGAGFSFVSINTAALAQVQETVAGLASGLLSSAAQLGGAVGLAVIVALDTARSGALLRTGSTAVAAQTGGLRLGLLLAAAVALAASVVAAIAMQRQKTSPAITPEPAPAPSGAR